MLIVYLYVADDEGWYWVWSEAGMWYKSGQNGKKTTTKKPYISQYLQDNGYINAGFGHEMADKDSISQQPSNHMTLSHGL